MAICLQFNFYSLHAHRILEEFRLDSTNMLLQYKSLIKESQDYGVKKANERAICSFLVRK